MVDSYESNPNTWRETLNFIQTFVQSSRVGRNDLRFALVTYDSDARVVFYFNSNYDSDAIITAVRNAQESTVDSFQYALADALRLVRTDVFLPTRGDRPNIANVVIIITNNDQNFARRARDTEATNQIKQTGARIIVNYVSSGSDNQLRQLASDPNDYLVFADTATFVNSITTIAGTACRASQITPAPPTGKSLN